METFRRLLQANGPVRQCGSSKGTHVQCLMRDMDGYDDVNMDLGEHIWGRQCGGDVIPGFVGCLY